MHMHKIVSPTQRSECKAGKRRQEESSILANITHPLPRRRLNRNTEDVDAVNGLVPWFFLTFPKADDVDSYPFFGKSLRGSTGSRIRRIIRKQENSPTLAAKSRAARMSS